MLVAWPAPNGAAVEWSRQTAPRSPALVPDQHCGFVEKWVQTVLGPFQGRLNTCESPRVWRALKGSLDFLLCISWDPYSQAWPPRRVASSNINRGGFDTDAIMERLHMEVGEIPMTRQQMNPDHRRENGGKKKVIESHVPPHLALSSKRLRRSHAQQRDGRRGGRRDKNNDNNIQFGNNWWRRGGEGQRERE